MGRLTMLLLAGITVMALAAASDAALITFTLGNDTGVTGGGTTGPAYNGPIAQNDIFNIAIFAQTDAGAADDEGVATFTLAFSYDDTKLEPQVHGTAKLLSAFTFAPASAPLYSWVADVEPDFNPPGFPTTAEVINDTDNNILTLGGGADAGEKNLGSNNSPVLIGQITFKALVDLTTSTTTIDVAGANLNFPRAWQGGDESKLFDSAAAGQNSGTAQIVLGQEIPEPATLTLLALGGAAAMWRRKRRA